MKRRTLLAATTSAAALVAGCAAAQAPGTGDDSSDGDDGGDDESSVDDGSDDLAETVIKTTLADCGDPDDETALAIEAGNAVRILGVTQAPNPCHEATVTSVEVEDGQLSVTVDVESTLATDEECIQCHGAIGYELIVERDPASIETLIVTHEEGDRHELDIQPANAVPSITDATIETTDTDCASDSEADEVEVALHGERIGLTGVRPAPDPCHAAILEDFEIDGKTLTVSIGVEDDRADGEVCAQCTGAIEYEAIVELVGATLIEEVRIDHVGASSHAIGVDTVVVTQ